KYQQFDAGNGHGVLSTPVVAKGTLYVSYMNAALYAMDAATGTQRWKLVTANSPSDPTIANDVVYIGSGSGSLYAVDARNGTVKWKIVLPGAISNGPSVVDTKGNTFCSALSGAQN
ncbi:MAG: PQQ-like beta-propeller repeat protein, partial [Bacteroidetes bacterium]|nr:PQQ-like beta-propeller repeat protein [Bacteroidota bacterium]